MRLSVSSIAWKPEDDDAVGAVLRAAGADAVELAPTAYWPDPLAVATPVRVAVRRAWERRGFPVVAIQSLLFGFADLNLFDPATRGAMRDRLAGMLDVARDLGARVLVFGSPRNRARGDLAPEAAEEIAAPFFRELGARAEERGVCLCIEPNPPAYGCDFVITAAEGRSLVERTGSPGFRLHLDVAGMLLAGDDPVVEARRSAGLLRHLHVSARQLGPVGPRAGIDYGAVIQAAIDGGYAGDVSIEMRAAGTLAERLLEVRLALETLRPVVPRAGGRGGGAPGRPGGSPG